MTSRYEASMDGVELSSLDSSIYVLNIQYSEPVPNIRKSRVAGRPGTRVTKKTFDSTSVTILFEIHEYDTEDRQEVLQKVQAWANGSILVTSDRPTQRLRCVCERYPKVDAKEWTQPISMTFTGNNPPYWEDSEETTVTTTGSADEDVPGNAPETLVSCVVTPGEAITTVTVQTGVKSITVNVSAVQYEKIYFGYDDNNIFYIKKGNDSVLDKRTAGSSDELSVPCGDESTFSVSSDGNVSAVFSFRGCWL